jgi:hypothetical protein
MLSIVGLGLAIALVPEGTHFSKGHHRIGLAVFLLGFLQPFIAMVRPKPSVGETKPRARWVWELVHKSTGYAALGLAVAAVFTGLAIAGAGIELMAAYAVYVIVLAVAWVAFERRRVWNSEREAALASLKTGEGKVPSSNSEDDVSPTSVIIRSDRSTAGSGSYLSPGPEVSGPETATPIAKHHHSRTKKVSPTGAQQQQHRDGHAPTTTQDAGRVRSQSSRAASSRTGV